MDYLKGDLAKMLRSEATPSFLLLAHIRNKAIRKIHNHCTRGARMRSHAYNYYVVAVCGVRKLR